MKKLFSGVQPTGTIHLGNYTGAIKNWVNLQNKYDCIFSIVDLHSITVKYNPKQLHKRVMELAKVYIASGIDPEKSIIFVQSDIKEHTELMWILSTVTPLGELNRMTQFKDKAQNNKSNVNLGLYAYPVLQAADILLYYSEFVPVGQDQVQHVELTREIARKFNKKFRTDLLPLPEELLSIAPRIIGIDGENKMSKSKNNYIGLTEDDKVINKKIMGAKTDPARIRKTDAGNPEICNVFSWHKIYSSESEKSECFEACKKAEIGCVECKKVVAGNILNIISPIRENYYKLEKKNSFVRDILKFGAEKAEKIAKKNINEIKKTAGLNL
ncbi:MAG: tryptophan--tRNA ligase [Candidatus Muiribacteriota bacterium]